MAKDRSHHEAARGVKTPTIRDLSKERPSATELESYPSLILAESDRGAAIMAGALVENALELAIRSSIVDLGSTTNKWFDGPNAPFSSFSAKISLGRALGIYGEHMEKRLATIKDIRNAFAHSSTPLDFKRAVVKDLVRKILPRQDVIDKSGHKSPVKVAFGTACIALARVLVDYAIKQGGREPTIHFP